MPPSEVMPSSRRSFSASCAMTRSKSTSSQPIEIKQTPRPAHRESQHSFEEDLETRNRSQGDQYDDLQVRVSQTLISTEQILDIYDLEAALFLSTSPKTTWLDKRPAPLGPLSGGSPGPGSSPHGLFDGQTCSPLRLRKPAFATSLCSMEFDSIRYSYEELCSLAVEIFNEAGVPSGMRLPAEKFQALVLAVQESTTNSNPYHTFRHAFDALQATYALSIETGTLALLEPLEKMALLVSALCHDLEHPGVSNAFLVATSSPLALVYNDKSVLENMHCVRAFQLMNRPGIDLLSSLSEADYTRLRNIVIGNILATDLEKHAHYCHQLEKQRDKRLEFGNLDAPEIEDTLSQYDKQLRMKLLLKCADLAGWWRPYDVAKVWGSMMAQEMFLQGDTERSLNMVVTPVCDRRVQKVGALQAAFTEEMVLPYMSLLCDLFPSLAPLLQTLRLNISSWQAAKEEDLQLSSSRPPRVIFESAEDEDPLGSSDGWPERRSSDSWCYIREEGFAVSRAKSWVNSPCRISWRSMTRSRGSGISFSGPSSVDF